MRNRKTDIEKYLRGELSPAEMHALEKAALNDPFLAEALEGVEQAGADNFLFDLHRLNRSVHARSRRRMAKGGKTIRMWGWTTAIAATILLLVISGFLVVNILKEQAAQEQAMHELASLQPEGDRKDTVLIPFPQEAPVAAVQRRPASLQADGPAARRGATITDPATTGAGARELEVDNVPVTKPAGDVTVAAHDGAAEESTVQAESGREARAKEESDVALRETPAEGPDATSAVLSGKDGGEAAKKSGRRLESGAPTRAATESPALPPASLRVKGKVVTPEGQGLPGVNVMIAGSRTGIVTDAGGNYELAVPAENSRLVFAFIGYGTREVEVGDQREVNVQLEEDMSTLSEVVVTGYSSVSAPRDDGETFSFAEPQGGRADFRDYLARAVRYPAEAMGNKVEGRVTVRFTVDPTGALSDFEVVKGIGYGCEEELIRAIQAGPPWNPSKRGERALPDQVKVRFRFELPR